MAACLRESEDGDVDVPGLKVIRERSRSLQLPSSSWVKAKGGHSWLQARVSGTINGPGVPHLLTTPTPPAAPEVEGPSPASESPLRASLPRLSWRKSRVQGSLAVCWGLVMAVEGADRSQAWGHTVVMGTRPWSMAAGMWCPPTPMAWAGM